MTRRPVSVACLALCVVSSSSAAQNRPTDSLGWLAGCWEHRTPNVLVQEQWSSASGGMLLGFSRTIRRDSVTEYEFVRIYGLGDTLVYDAQPSRQARAEFRAVRPFAPELVFSNPAHDFPTKIAYRPAGADTLLARIEGMRGGQMRAITFPYVRVRCP